MIRVLLADDHPVTREGLALIVGNQPGVEVVAAVADGLAAVDAYRQVRPDVAILDLKMPRMSGLAATERICAEFPGAAVLVLTTFGGDEDVYRAVRAGAKGYLLKDAPRDMILEAVRAVAAGNTFFTTEVVAQLTTRIAARELTPRELDVLQLIAAGVGNKQIGHALGIAEATVKTHVNTLMTKLDVASRTEAVAVAMRRGLLRDA